MKLRDAPIVLGLLALAVSCSQAAATPLERQARFLAGDIVTRRGPVRWAHRSLIQGHQNPLRQYTWVVGLHPYDQAQVHSTLQAHQGKLLHPLPGKDHHHWLVQATETAVHQLLKAHEEVTAAPLPPSFKVSRAIDVVLRNFTATGQYEQLTLVVLLPAETKESLTAFAVHSSQQLSPRLGSGCQVSTRDDGIFIYITVCLKGAMKAAAWAAAQPAVTWVDVHLPAQTQNLYANAITQNPQKLHAVMDSDPTQPPPADVLKGTASDYFPLWKAGITGKGQVVTIVDSGIDPESCFFYDDHANIETGFKPLSNVTNYQGGVVNHTSMPNHRKIVELISVFGKIDTVGHGTHTAGTIAGSQQGFNAQTDKPILGTGICPDCKLAVIDGAADTPDNTLVDAIPAEVFDYVENTLGARVASASVGLDSYTYLDTHTQTYHNCWYYDMAAFTGSNLLHIFAAGNEGTTNRYLRDTNGTVATWALCKNTIGVGAAENWEAASELKTENKGMKDTPLNVLTSDGKVNTTLEELYVRSLGPAHSEPDVNPGILVFQQVNGQVETTPVLGPLLDLLTPTPPAPVSNTSNSGASSIATMLTPVTASAPESSSTTGITSDSSIPADGFSLTLDGVNDFIYAPGFFFDELPILDYHDIDSVSFKLVLADPFNACNLTASHYDNQTENVMLLVRKTAADITGDNDTNPDTCTPYQTALAAKDAGAAAVLLYWADDAYLSAWFNSSAVTDPNFVYPMPMLASKAVGDNLAALLREGLTLKTTWTYKPAPKPKDVLLFENIAAFSGYGDLNVTSTSVIKPDIVAPGYQLSAYSDKQYTTGKMDQCAVVRLEGTSMATPVVSAAAALTRQYFNDGFYPTGTATPANAMDPSAALVKAVLIAGTAAMTGYSIADGKRLAPPPSPYQGHGRVDLFTSLPLADNKEWNMAVVDNNSFTSSESYATYTVYVSPAQSGYQPDMIVTLVYTDYPGFPGSFSIYPLVNDLDLSITGPGSTAPVWGNNRTDGDRVNNVEKVIIPQAAPGTYTINVTAHYIYHKASPQTYSMVVLGNIQDFRAAGVQAEPDTPGMPSTPSVPPSSGCYKENVPGVGIRKEAGFVLVGSQHFTCLPGYKPAYTSQAQATCQSNGSWVVDIDCVYDGQKAYYGNREVPRTASRV